MSYGLESKQSNFPKLRASVDDRIFEAFRPAVFDLGPRWLVSASGHGHDRQLLGGGFSLLRPRHQHRLPGRKGRRQHPVLRSRRRGALAAFPEPIHLRKPTGKTPVLTRKVSAKTSLEGLGHHAEARRERGHVRNIPLLQAARHERNLRAHQHDSAQEKRSVPRRFVPRYGRSEARLVRSRVDSRLQRASCFNVHENRLVAPRAACLES